MREISIRKAVDINLVGRGRRLVAGSRQLGVREVTGLWELGVATWELYDGHHYGRMRSHTCHGASRQQERAHRQLREVPEGAPGPRRASLAGRARTAHLRKRIRAGVEDVGRPPEDDPQRVPPDALAEGGAGADRQAHGGLLLRRKRGAPARLRSATDEVMCDW